MIFSSKIDPAYDTDHDEYWQNFEVRQKLRDMVLDLGPKEGTTKLAGAW
jgi:hypothetical protein